MTSVLRFCTWLLVPVLALFSLTIMAEPIEGAAQALHLLGYLSAIALFYGRSWLGEQRRLAV